MKLFHIPIILIIAAATMLSACSSPTVKEEEQPADNLILISNEQFEAEGMQLEDVIMHPFSQILKTNGIVSASPQSKADVYSYVPGITKSIAINLGSFVRKGQQLCTIESKEFIKLQQQYLVSLASLKATEANYQRVKQLYDEKISSHKDFLDIEREYKILNARIKALKAELNILNVDLKNLEEGNLSTYLRILSPIEGSITKLDCNIGQFVNSQDLLMKIVDSKDLQLHFFAYQKSVDKFKLGQDLNVYSPDNFEMNYKAKIISIGKSIDPDSKSIRCIAKFDDDEEQAIIDGMYFQVEVIIDTMNTRAIPTEAIIKSGHKYFILVKEKQDDKGMVFQRAEIEIGGSSNGFTQILGDKDFKDVLIKGAYYFQTE